ncbi:HupE/UreJ family protein [Aureisphaera galaxeae]|uniref:HupE/UreJ family protein n=1 Tax=Aureisphaera galaxeae TaxID=1538023 RepID=UPI0023509B69|nr:HupE/UreJ family protein [Aureisphaera galaxeae]MDC8005959.1 HupE/UreJ family protein [Aureisphaera galaxeae]
MNDFTLYFKLGLEHVLDLEGYDHALFLIALAITFQIKDWKRLLGLVTFFTLGHTISLYLSSKGILPLSSGVVEMLIPATILATALYVLYASFKDLAAHGSSWVLWITTLLFGIIHGFGFGRYYNQINDEGGFAPLLSFALGIEVAQIIIVIGVLLVSLLFTSLLKGKRSILIRLVAILITLVSAYLTVERSIEYFGNI